MRVTFQPQNLVNLLVVTYAYLILMFDTVGTYGKEDGCADSRSVFPKESKPVDSKDFVKQVYASISNVNMVAVH